MADGGDILDSIGSGIGGLLGGINAGNAISAAGNSIAGTIGQGTGNVAQLIGAGAAGLAPYNIEGVGSIPATSHTLATNPNIGLPRTTTDPISFEDFSKNFNMSEGAKYLLDTAKTSQDNSAASKGGFYSGANMRAQDTIAEGIANTDLLDQYKAMLSGQEQNFTQQETSYKNLYDTEALGEKAAASDALLAASGAGTIGSLFGSSVSAQASLANAQAQAQNAKGSGLGSLIGGGLSFLAK